MKLGYRRQLWACLIIFSGTLMGVFFSADCMAGEGATRGRIIYNNIMLVVNFGILVFLFLKYAKEPLIGFLNQERQKTEEKLNQINSQFEAAKKAMDAEAAKLEDVTAYIEKIRGHILDIAQREKEKIIEDARHAAYKMVKDAESYSVHQLVKAKKKLSHEMIDMAISVVEDRLRHGITEKDNEILINRFLANINNANALFEKRN